MVECGRIDRVSPEKPGCELRLIRFFSPAILIGLPVIASFLVWLVPGTGTYLRGFDVRSPVEPGGMLLLTGWYALCILVVTLSGAVGRVITPARSLLSVEMDVRFERRFYAVLTLLAVFGVLGAYFSISRQVAIIPAIQSGQANDLSAVLLDGSGIGTLRYAAIVAAPVGVFLAMQKKATWFVAGVNVILLLGVALLSSRLSLIMAVSILLFLYVHQRPDTRVRIVPIVLLGSSMFGILAALNYSRNSGYYKLFGVENPIMMNLYQIAAYVGSPTQVAVGVSRAIFEGRLNVAVGLDSGLQAVVPTFLQQTKGNRAAVTDEALYGQQVDIAPNLNSNSSFADTYAHYGWWGLIATLVVLGLAAMLFAHLMQYRSVLAAGAGVLGYGFLEYWRGFLFNTGNLVFILLALALAAVIARAVTPVAKGVRLSDVESLDLSSLSSCSTALEGQRK